MSSQLNVEVNEADEITTIKLSGSIGEDNDLAQLGTRVTRSRALINTANVERINSCGVRDWVTLLGELDKKACQVYLVECSPTVMTQVNLVNNFLGNGHIVSFYAPYFCASCDADKMLLIHVDQALKATPYQAPTCRCDQCDHTMEFDDIESSYFAFLSRIKPPNVGALAQQIAELSPANHGTLRKRANTVNVSMPNITITAPSSSAPRNPASSVSAVSAVTGVSEVSSRSNVGGLLNDFVTNSEAEVDNRPNPPIVNRLLFLIAGLLTVSVGLLVYVALR